MSNDILIRHLEGLDKDVRELRSEVRQEMTVMRTNIKIDTNEIREDIQELNAFKFKLTGVASFLSAVMGYVIAYFSTKGQ